MRQFIVDNCGWFVLIGFFSLGWTYYMVGNILMRGSIFIGLRRFVDQRAEKGSGICLKIREMLGCLMCTATQCALWTIGLTTFVLGVHFNVVNNILGAALELLGVIAPTTAISLPWYGSLPLMAGISFAVSLAISGQAWAIKCVMEHREDKFLALRNEFRAREIELLAQISALEMNGARSETYEFDME